MTVASETNRNDYVGDGAHAEYQFTFPIQAESDLRVVVVAPGALGVLAVLTLTTDYTVDGVGETAGGDITLVAGKAWMTAGSLANGYAIAIRRAPALKQNADVRNQGSYYPETHEDLYDRLVMQIQSLQEQINRCLKLPESEAGTAGKTVLPAAVDRALKVISFDVDGKPIASIPVSSYVASMTYIGMTALTELPTSPSGPMICVVETGGVKTMFFYNGASWESLMTMS